MSEKFNRIIIFTGDGKGKTTAALGMALRACGHGQRVLVVQFIKADQSSGEVSALRDLPKIELIQCGLGFVPPPTHAAFPAHQQAAAQALNRVKEAIESSLYNLVILDEVCTAIDLELVSTQSVLNTIALAKDHSNLVLTGRGAPNALIERADTVTEMHCVKHAFNSGRKADAGVEW